MTDTLTLWFVDTEDDTNRWEETTWVGAIPDRMDTVLPRHGGEYMVTSRVWSFTQLGSQNADRGRWAPLVQIYVTRIQPAEDESSLPERCGEVQYIGGYSGFRCLRPAGHPEGQHDWGGVYPDSRSRREWGDYDT
jgi:hypothetical protein